MVVSILLSMNVPSTDVPSSSNGMTSSSADFTCSIRMKWWKRSWTYLFILSKSAPFPEGLSTPQWYNPVRNFHNIKA